MYHSGLDTALSFVSVVFLAAIIYLGIEIEIMDLLEEGRSEYGMVWREESKRENDLVIIL